MEQANRPRPAEERSDDELVLRVQQGDRASYDRLVQRYQRRIYFLALRMARDHDAADDIAQETFVRAWFAIGSFTVGRAFYTWLYRICMNLSISHLRSGKSVVPASRLGEDSDPLERDSGAADASETIVSEESAARIESAIDSLSPKYKAVMVLRVYEEMSYEDIARTLGISVGTVMSRLFRARRSLRDALEQDER